MEPRKRRGSKLCEKCRERMEVHLTYHKCPVCGKVIKKDGPGYLERSSHTGEKQQSLTQRLRAIVGNSESTTRSSEFMELEPSGSTALERAFLWLLFLLLGIHIHLHLAISDPLTTGGASWGSPFLFRYLPMLLFFAAIAVVFHTDAGFRRTMIYVTALAAIACLLVFLISGTAFHDELVAVYPTMDNLTLIGRRRHPLVTAPGGTVWLLGNAAYLGFCAWHIFHEERRHGRM